MLKTMGQNFSQLPVEVPTTGDVLALIETPKGSRNKYAFDVDLGAFRLEKMLPQENVFPFDFGFIPSTKADDGDPLDLLVPLEDPVPMGCAISVRLIGAIEAEQKEKGEAWVRNDRLVGVATHAHEHANVKSLKDIDSRLLDAIEAFFAHFNKLEGKEFASSIVVGRNRPRSSLAQHGVNRNRNEFAAKKAWLLEAESVLRRAPKRWPRRSSRQM
jgi:inorganic pyrophosphatase